MERGSRRAGGETGAAGGAAAVAGPAVRGGTAGRGVGRRRAASAPRYGRCPGVRRRAGHPRCHDRPARHGHPAGDTRLGNRSAGGGSDPSPAGLAPSAPLRTAAGRRARAAPGRGARAVRPGRRDRLRRRYDRGPRHRPDDRRQRERDHLRSAPTPPADHRARALGDHHPATADRAARTRTRSLRQRGHPARTDHRQRAPVPRHVALPDAPDLSPHRPRDGAQRALSAALRSRPGPADAARPADDARDTTRRVPGRRRRGPRRFHRSRRGTHGPPPGDRLGGDPAAAHVQRRPGDPAQDAERREPWRDLWDQLAAHVDSIPAHEYERQRRAGILRGHSVDSTHPPTHLRRACLLARPAVAAAVVTDDERQHTLDTELATSRARLARQVLAR